MRLERYDDADMSKAQDDMLELELSLLGSDADDEIAIFRAETEALFRSQVRYFHSSSLIDEKQMTSSSERPFAC